MFKLREVFSPFIKKKHFSELVHQFVRIFQTWRMSSANVSAQEEVVLKIRFLLEGVVMPAVGLPGICGKNLLAWNFIFNIFFTGNLVSIYIMCKAELDLKISFVRLIITVCIFDSFCIFFSISTFSLPLISELYRHQVHMSWQALSTTDSIF